MKFATLILLLLSLFFAMLLLAEPILVQANGTECPPDTICIDNPLEAETITEVINAIIDLLKIIALPLAIIMIVWGGIQIMTGYSTGEKEKKVVQGKKTITYAVIGLAIVYAVSFIVGIIEELLKKE